MSKQTDQISREVCGHVTEFLINRRPPDPEALIDRFADHFPSVPASELAEAIAIGLDNAAVKAGEPFRDAAAAIRQGRTE